MIVRKTMKFTKELTQTSKINCQLKHFSCHVAIVDHKSAPTTYMQ